MAEWDRGKGWAYYWAGRQRWCEECDCANPYRDLLDVQNTLLEERWPWFNNRCWDCASARVRKGVEETPQEAASLKAAKEAFALRHQALCAQKAIDARTLAPPVTPPDVAAPVTPPELLLRARRSRSPRR